MFERYYEEGSDWIPREYLSTPTRRNLRWLEKELGYQFDAQARKAQFGYRPSYLIHGISPQGEEVAYERRETSARAAGQTYIWEGGKRRSLGDLGIPNLSVRGKEREWVEGHEAKRRLGEVEDLDIEGMSDKETKRLSQMLDEMEHKPYIWWEGVRLGEEDKKELKKFLDEYKRKLEE